MSTDRELLELAAKAVGLVGYRWCGRCFLAKWNDSDGGWFELGSVWAPLNSDGDALRLAVSLGLVVDCSRPSAGEPFKLHHFGQENFSEPYAATRRAIVRAAAEIGRSMK